MSKIKEIRLYNFKAFYGETKIELEGKNLLMYGENGSGKSSVYWALYTLLQSSNKTEEEIKKYFNPKNEQNLINTHLIESQSYIDEKNEKIVPDSIGLNSNVQIILENSTKFTIDSRGLTTDKPDELEFLNKRSDFISHRLLINFYNYRNSKQINLWEVFVRDIFPFVTIDKDNGDKNLSEELKEIEESLPFSFKTFPSGEKKFTVLKKSEHIKVAFINRIKKFNEDIEYWIEEINTAVTEFYQKYFKNRGEKEIKISLKLKKELEYIYHYDQKYQHNGADYFRNCNYVGLSSPFISLNIEVENDDKTYTSIPKPQSYFNEAKLTSIALAVRFSLLLDFIRPDDGDKFLALDDLLVSLDMSNRDKVLDIILNEFAPKYKIYLFTHEMEFFNYCKYKIGQKGKNSDWEVKEIYFDDEDLKPLIINSSGDYLKKSKDYFKAKDYVASAIYLRKDIENFIKERIPDEFKRTLENEYHNLDHYWNLLLERYQALSITIPAEISHWFKKIKLVVLNPSAHANLSQQIYKVELQKAFEFRKKIEDIFPKNEQILVIPENTQFVFKHPTEDYVFEFYFKSDFLCDKILQNYSEVLPKCIITYYSFNDLPYWDFKNSKVYDNDFIQKKILNKIVEFETLIENLKKITVLSITDDMFYERTFLKNSELSLAQILQNFKI